jgi:hypothetical protein
MGKSEIQISEFSAFEPKLSAFTLISGHVKPRIFSLCSAVRQTQLHPSLSLDPVSKTCKPPHTNDKGMSGEEISQ